MPNANDVFSKLDSQYHELDDVKGRLDVLEKKVIKLNTTGYENQNINYYLF